MLDYSIMKPEGILVLKVHTPLSAQDFSALGAAVDAYLSDHPKLHGVLIHAKTFPGWDSIAGFGAHLDFIRAHYNKVERVALVTDSHMADVAQSLAKYFSAAQVRHFAFAENGTALDWLQSD